ncbi:3-hydroxyisobutyrate dehydrogenase [Noviherbaspirillum humi]|uniref:L-threonate dehydrogenase n=1 Tax=Noviherbaspirillum humi TaxID=1688639 RepID=A0A239JPU7_9BURK|nr:L-threonate dehydrogenase [Noviherbaspirillum humi]SNT07789.1 3-hydroxyisobutyrate dehydrogenase [Noviherbaspirillum humi]
MSTAISPPAGVGVIGLGSMGRGVAQSLLKAGFTVHGYDVHDAALQQLAQAGGMPAASPAEMARHAEAVVILVVNAEQTESVLFGKEGAAAALPRGAAVICSATVAPDYAAQLGARLQEMGLLMIDAPVSGGAAKAATGELTVMGSGSAQAFERCQQVLDAIAARVYRLGDTAGQGSRVKMINQLLAGVHIAAAAEAMAWGIKAGVDPQTLYDVISQSAGNSWMFENRVPHILDGDYAPRSAVNIFVKDLRIVLDAAHRAAFPLPLTAAAHQMFLMAASAGLGAEDDAAVVKIFPGVDLPHPAAGTNGTGTGA